MKALTILLLRNSSREIDSQVILEQERPKRRYESSLGELLDSIDKRRLELEQYKAERPRLSQAGYIFQQDEEYQQHIFIKNIISYIKENVNHIKDIDWIALKEKDYIGSWNSDLIQLIKPFDNASFWKYATHRLEGVDADFIKANITKINFGEDEQANVYANATRQYFQIPTCKLPL